MLRGTRGRHHSPEPSRRRQRGEGSPAQPTLLFEGDGQGGRGLPSIAETQTGVGRAGSRGHARAVAPIVRNGSAGREQVLVACSRARASAADGLKQSQKRRLDQGSGGFSFTISRSRG